MSRFTIVLAEKEAREGKRYTQKDISDITGVSPAVVSRWMKGDIEGASLVTVKKFCDFFDCQPGDLIYFDRSKPNGEKQPA